MADVHWQGRELWQGCRYKQRLMSLVLLTEVIGRLVPYWLVLHPPFRSFFLVLDSPKTSSLIASANCSRLILAWLVHYSACCQMTQPLLCWMAMWDKMVQSPRDSIGTCKTHIFDGHGVKWWVLKCWTAKCCWASHHSSPRCTSLGCSSLPTPLFLAEHSILFIGLSMILWVLPCLVLSCNSVPFYARNSARISPVGWQACKLCPLKELPSDFGACTTFIHLRHDKFVDWKSGVFVPLKLSDKFVLGCINCVQVAWTSLLNRAFSFAYQCGHELPEPTKWQTQGMWRLWFLAFMWKLLCLSLGWVLWLIVAHQLFPCLSSGRLHAY